MLDLPEQVVAEVDEYRRDRGVCPGCGQVRVAVAASAVRHSDENSMPREGVPWSMISARAAMRGHSRSDNG